MRTRRQILQVWLRCLMSKYYSFLAEIFAVQIGQHSILSSAHPAAVRNKIVIYTLSKRFYGGRIALSLFAYKIVSRAWPLLKKIV